MTDKLTAPDVLKIECRARDLVSIEKAGRADAFRIDRSIMLEDDVPALIAALREAVGKAERSVYRPVRWGGALGCVACGSAKGYPHFHDCDLAAFLERWKGL